jgi:uncharacterized DUF497 family protein
LELEWDENKRRRLLEERGLDILYAALIFENAVLTWVDERRDYGERRLVSLGVVGGEAFTVVHTERSGATRLITAWKGGRRDLERYQAGVARRAQGDEEPGGDPPRRPRDRG